jgi:HSP20 family protein
MFTLSPEWMVGDFSDDIRETESHYAISVDMPGVRKEDLKVELADGRLTVTGERRRLGPGGETFKISRAFALPKMIDSAKIEAAYHDGVLDITVPKAAEARPRMIPVTTGSSGLFEKLLGSKKNEETEGEPKVS